MRENDKWEDKWSAEEWDAWHAGEPKQKEAKVEKTKEEEVAKEKKEAKVEETKEKEEATVAKEGR